MDNTELFLENMSDFTVNEIQTPKFELLPSHEVNLRSNRQTTCINVEKEFAINGSLNLHNNVTLFSEPRKDTVGNINGKISGLENENKLIIDVEKLTIKGEIQSMYSLQIENEWFTLEGKRGMLCSGCVENTVDISVLLLRFASLTMSSTPDNEQLTRWKKTMDKLSTAFSSSNESTEDIAQHLVDIYNDNASDSSFINLDNETKLYLELRSIAKNLKTNGIQIFEPNILIDALKRAHYNNQLIKFQEFQKRCLSVSTKMRDLFLSKKKGFKKLVIILLTLEGILKHQKDGIYENFTKSWNNHGSLKSGGDIEIQSDRIFQSKYGKTLTTLGDIFMKGGTARIENVKSPIGL
uniref:Uncharacterized protein n=1 Tax=Panagrolaimus superbus TaxID=310955 RepID=A0A914YDD6_9BILA